MRRYRFGRLAMMALLPLLLCGNPGEAARKRSSRWGANYFPNVPLITHEGKTVRFFDDLIKDKVVVINFIYTTCPDACPLETARLTELYKILGDRVGASGAGPVGRDTEAGPSVACPVGGAGPDAGGERSHHHGAIAPFRFTLNRELVKSK